ncbi:hypothetical protein EH223_14720 [candidate division KSB1 bacterium]|nr:hypothetical protein [candidate division KSB1 bacterium]RQW01569.1 MAG: hypothetical protein EH223_14720 [candidate division KSB1 bacterium]
MEPEDSRYALTEYQELLVDEKGQLVESKGKLFDYKSIGGRLEKGGKIQQILGEFWSKDVKQLCTFALERGISSTIVFENYHNGSNLALQFGFMPVVHKGIVCGIVLKVCDITVAKRLEHQRRIREKMANISQLAAHMVHKMNNPIAAALNRIGGLLVKEVDSRDPDVLLHELRSIQEQLYAISLITTGLVAFSNENIKDFKLVQVNSVLQNVFHLMHFLDAQRNIKLDVNLDTSLPRILGSEVTLEQCFVNICKNAVEAMPGGGILTIISKVDEQFPDFINVMISDQGSGIAPENKQLVWEPFYTTKDKSHAGLGLSVSFAIVSRHNGSIEIASQPGTGSTFQIILPIAKI